MYSIISTKILFDTRKLYFKRSIELCVRASIFYYISWIVHSRVTQLSYKNNIFYPQDLNKINKRQKCISQLSNVFFTPTSFNECHDFVR